ncbi:MAG: alanine--tRNA ligase, partial [bacterium]|nr:alanine--tRNA ligase [bacterium]
DEQIKKTEDLVNEKIKENLPVSFEVMDKKLALESGALGFFTEKYADKVTVYTIGDPSAGSGQAFSREICGGPHVDFTSSLKSFKIIKQKNIGHGMQRIYAALEN